MNEQEIVAEIPKAYLVWRTVLALCVGFACGFATKLVSPSWSYFQPPVQQRSKSREEARQVMMKQFHRTTEEFPNYMPPAD